jgi:heme-degrading monooxygenase HmoA
VFARLSIYELPADRTRDASRAFEEALQSIATSRGFSEAFFLVNQEGKGVALTIWEDDGALTASRVAATRIRSEAVRSIDGEVISVEEFAVAVHRES